MIVDLVLLVLLGFLIHRLLSYSEASTYIISIGVILHVILLILYRYNLRAIGRQVYFSDAEVYWKNTIDYLSGDYYYAYNQTYILVCVLIQKLSPFIWVGWNNIFNLLCTDISIIMLVGFTYRNVRRKKDNIAARDAGNLLLEFLWLNPLIYYSLIRNLKDAFYLLLITALGMFLAWVLENEGDSLVRLRRLLFVAVSLGLSYVLYNIRPWAFFSSLLAVGLFVRSRVRRPSFAIILLMFVVIGFLRTAFIARAIAVWFPVILANFRRIGLLTSLAGALKFVVGPGPVRSILGSRYFLFYTDIGNLAAFIGSIMWWVFLAGSIYFIMKNIREFGKTNLVEKYFLYTTIVYIAIYAVTYGGSAELRLRGVMYVIGGFSIVNVFYDNRYRLDKEIGILSGIILVFVGGIVFGV